MADDRERLAATFDTAADLYQEARPDYPEPLFDRLVELTGLRRGDSVLEVGAGPGKATLPLARRGLRITAVEPGRALAERARENLRGLDVEVVQTRFEDWTGPWGTFDAVVAATSWHWVDPAVRYRLAAAALRPGGHLATWEAQHVFPAGGDPFFEELQEVYDAIGEALPDTTTTPRPRPGQLPAGTDDIEACGLFDVVAVEHVDWTVDYDADGYLRLLSTFSGHIAMSPQHRDHLFAEVRRRLALRPDGRLRRGWGAVLRVARRRDDETQLAGRLARSV